MVKKNKGLNDSIDNTVKNITNFIEDNFWILFILLLIIPSVVTTILYPMFTNFDKTITIKKKYTRTRGRYGDSYFVVDETNTIYQVNNLFYNFDFNRAEDWNNLEEGKTYKIKGYGFRIGFLDMYPTVSSII
jgi:hypothetical protein